MPNTLIEYSPNASIAPEQFSGLLQAIHTEISDVLGIDIARFRTRVVQVNQYLANSGADDDAFVFVTLSLLPGRTLELKQAVVSKLVELVHTHLKPADPKQKVRASVELTEIDPDVYEPVELTA